MIGALAMAWAGLALTGAVVQRPRPHRLDELRPAAQRSAQLGVGDLVGGWVLWVWGRGRPPAVDADRRRRLGHTLIAALAPLPVLPMAAPFAAMAAWVLPAARHRRARARHLLAIEDGLPEVIDLLVLGVGAGLSVPQALAAVAARADGPLAAELGLVMADVARGRRLGDALELLPARAGEPTRALVGALVASERYGAPLEQGLERLAAEVRTAARHRAEEVARKVPVKLLFPLVVCILPAFALLTVAPLIASALRSLRL